MPPAISSHSRLQPRRHVRRLECWITAAVMLAAAAGRGSGQSSAAIPATSADTVSLDDRTRIAAQIDALVRRNFAHWSGVAGLQGAAYDALATAYRARAAATGDRRAFDLETMAFLASLQNGHTDFYDAWLVNRDGAPFPFAVRPLGARWVIAGSRLRELRPGDIVASIDGEPFEAFFQRQRRYIGASSERQARLGLPYRTYLFPQIFTLTLADGREVSVRRAWPTAPVPTPATTTAASSPAAPPAVRVPHRWLAADTIAYVMVPRFGDPAYQREALHAVERYQHAAALLLDLRGNGGGSTPWRLIKALQGSVWGGLRVERDLARMNPLKRIIAHPVVALARVPRYRGRLYVLVDDGCASACEDLVGALHGRPNVALIGDTTYGSSGQPRFLRMDNGMQARVSARRYLGADGKPFEGVGIAPDVVVPLTPEAIASRGDPVLARAVAIARERIGLRGDR